MTPKCLSAVVLAVVNLMLLDITYRKYEGLDKVVFQWKESRGSEAHRCTRPGKEIKSTS